MTEQAIYSSDSPLSNPEGDRFSRWPFAKRVSDVIAKRNDPSSIVIGLFGAWGDGKTTVLNFIEESLKVNPNVICIRFNPWRYGTEDQLLEGFFLDIAEALDTKLITTGDKIKDIFKKVVPAAAGALGQKDIGDSVAQFMSGPTLSELRSRIESALEDAKKRVVILADDIDRLEKEEIHATFRLVKLTADFKYTSYVLAFDEQVVSSALQDRYGAGTENAGKAFLEKIIQVPLNLPSVDKKVIRNFCFEGVDRALGLSDIKLTDQQCQEFARDFSIAFDKKIKTPRKAKQYGNILMFSLPILKGETNPVDLMLIEGVRVFYPKLYETIKNNGDMFYGTARDRSYGNSDKDKSQIITTIERSIESSDPEEIDGIKCLLKSMFPKLESVYGNTNYGSDWEKSWAEAQRICSKSYFQRYFTYAVPDDDIPDRTIAAIIETSSGGSVSETTEKFAELLTSQNADRLIRKLRTLANSINEKASATLAGAILAHSDRYPNPENLFDWNNPFAQAAMLVSDLIQNITDKADRVSLSKIYVESASDLAFSIEIFRWLRREDKDKPEADAFKEEEINIIGLALGGRINTILSSGVDITIEYPKICGSILYQAKKYDSETEVLNYLKQLFQSSKKSVFRLLDLYTPTSWGMESGISHKSDFERSQYNSIIAVVNPDILISAMAQEVGELPPVPEDYPRFDDKDRNLQLLKQFLWIHNFVLKEQLQSVAEESPPAQEKDQLKRATLEKRKADKKRGSNSRVDSDAINPRRSRS